MDLKQRSPREQLPYQLALVKDNLIYDILVMFLLYPKSGQRLNKRDKVSPHRLSQHLSAQTDKERTKQTYVVFSFHLIDSFSLLSFVTKRINRPEKSRRCRLTCRIITIRSGFRPFVSSGSVWTHLDRTHQVDSRGGR